MLWFPQLDTGASVQFPVRRRIARRTVLTEQPDGRVVKLAATGATVMEWTLAFEGLSGQETANLEALFSACEGRLGSFVFLDPLDNLLKWSEDLTAPVWAKDAGLVVTTDIPDPLGGLKAVRVTGGGELRQTIAGPSTFEYCLSVYARSSSAARFRLCARTGEIESARTVAAGTAWRRFEHTVKLAIQTEAITFGVSMEPGAEIELFGPQAEAQRGASRYKRTASRAGVYAAARFADDALEITADGPDSYSCRVRVRSAVED